MGHSDSGGLESSLELTDFSLMYQKSVQKLSTDEYYSESVMKELKKFNVSLDDLIPYYKLILYHLVDIQKKIYPQMYKQAENYKNIIHDYSLNLSFDVANQILTHLNNAKIHSNILMYKNSDISTLTEKDISIVLYLSGYVFGIFYRRLRSKKSNASSYCQ